MARRLWSLPFAARHPAGAMRSVCAVLVLAALSLACHGSSHAGAQAPDPYFPSVPAYPGARLLCTQHVSAASSHIEWRGYVTSDPVERVRAFYETRLGGGSGPTHPVLERSPASLRIRLPGGTRIVSIHAVGAGHPTCDVSPAPTDRTFIVVSQRNG